jgi:hypothetical protein
VLIDLDRDEALVLSDLLHSRGEEVVEALALEAAERNALWALEGALEKVLVEPFSADYESLLEATRKALVERGGE